MSSATRSKASAKFLPQPEAVCLIAYGNNPVPFYYDKKTSALDLRFVNGFTANTSIDGDDEDRWVRAHLDNGHFLINNLGTNFKTWYETRYGADAGSITVHEPGVGVKANTVAMYFEPNSNSSFSSERSTPISYESAAGDELTDYFATILFKKGLVITYTKSGVRYYRGFATLWSEGNT